MLIIDPQYDICLPFIYLVCILRMYMQTFVYYTNIQEVYTFQIHKRIGSLEWAAKFTMVEQTECHLQKLKRMSWKYKLDVWLELQITALFMTEQSIIFSVNWLIPPDHLSKNSKILKWFEILHSHILESVTKKCFKWLFINITVSPTITVVL